MIDRLTVTCEHGGVGVPFTLGSYAVEGDRWVWQSGPALGGQGGYDSRTGLHETYTRVAARRPLVVEGRDGPEHHWICRRWVRQCTEGPARRCQLGLTVRDDTAQEVLSLLACRGVKRATTALLAASVQRMRSA